MAVVEEVKSISLLDVKKGYYITLEDGKQYAVCKRGQVYHLIPISIKDQIAVNMYDIHKPKIITLYNDKGNPLKIVRVDENEKADN